MGDTCGPKEDANNDRINPVEYKGKNVIDV
jgi:hypothetical protein